MQGDPAAVAAAAQNSSLLWGIYRPNLYFGTRARLPDTLMTGLMWFGTQDFSGPDRKASWPILVIFCAFSLINISYRINS
jgi:hypothetical protein